MSATSNQALADALTALNQVLQQLQAAQAAQPPPIVSPVVAPAVYTRIKQPEIWAQWFQNQVEFFEAGTLVDCQSFMNSATLKFTKISSKNCGFEGSISTVQEDIVAMLASSKYKKNSPGMSTANPPDDNNSAPGQRVAKKFPPFVKHFKTGTGYNATSFKPGDKKEWNNTTWYYCDCPTHRDHHKWHTHTHEKYRTRKKWLADSSSSRNPPPSIAQVWEGVNDDGTALTNLTGLTSQTGTSSGSSTDITTMLATAFSLASGNSTAQTAIADALNALHDV